MMRLLLLLLACLVSRTLAMGQPGEVLTHSLYADSSLWMGDLTHFRCSSEDTIYLQAPEETSLSYLASPSSIMVRATWEISMNMRFNPSSSNYAKIYLSSNTDALTGPLKGYFVRVGHTADNVTLIRQDGVTETLIIDGKLKLLDLDPVSLDIRVTRDQEGNWKLWTRLHPSAEYILEGTAQDKTYRSSTWWGLTCSYTKTRRDKFSFARLEVTGEAFLDTVPRYKAKLHDVLIHEIMADPDPPVLLPVHEYVELYNRTGMAIDLEGWTFSAGSSPRVLPPLILEPGEFLVLCHTSAVEAFAPLGKVAGILSSSTTLTNTGMELSLHDQEGTLIHRVKYGSSWHTDLSKSDGGWSLEMIDPDLACLEKPNWASSVDRAGGTPGKPNSSSLLEVAIKAVQLLHLAIPNDSTVQLHFSGPLDPYILEHPGTFRLSQGIGTPSSIAFGENENLSLVITLPHRLLPGVIYSLEFESSLQDCLGNEVKGLTPRELLIPQPAESSDVVINEILFNPKEESVDFVELFNRSEKVIDLGELSLAQVDPVTLGLKTLYSCSGKGIILFPGDYKVLSVNGESIRSIYDNPGPGFFLDLPAIPAMNNDKGHIRLVNRSQETIDEVSYQESMHYPLLKQYKGVSLERLNPDRESMDIFNWHSASSLSGYATPGSQNSQFEQLVEGDEWLTIDPVVFSPDNDGFDDWLNIRIKLPGEGYMLTIRVFDRQGRVVRDLVMQETCPTEHQLIWNGVDNAGRLAPSGMYVLFAEIYNLKGTVKQFKKACALVTR
jgi:hypothetical protein